MRLALLLIVQCLAAQSVLTLTGPATIKPGLPIPVTLELSGTGPRPVALQWTLVAPMGYVLPATPTTSVAEKTLACSVPAGLLCVLYGFNVTPIANGPVASLTAVHMPIAGGGSGRQTFSLAGVIAADSTGAALPITSAPYSVLVTRADLNNSGSVDRADVDLMVAQATNIPCTDDQNGDGVCNVIDVLLVIIAALGGSQ